MEKYREVELIVQLIQICLPLDLSDRSCEDNLQWEVSSVIMLSENSLFLGAKFES
jgi:hypothetical protein